MSLNDSDNLEAILGYLALPHGGEEARLITGLTEASIADVLRGHPIADPAKRRHVEVVAELVRLLADSRQAATGSAGRGTSGTAWLQSGTVTTSRGTKTPLEVLTDTDLAADALRGLRR